MTDVVVRPSAPVAPVTPAAAALRHDAVLKIGGSVLTGPAGYAAAASHLVARLASEPQARFVVVVSAEFGHTDALRDEASAIGATGPGRPDSGGRGAALLDLLWSTGETRSVALLSPRLRALGASATGLAVHETGLERAAGGDGLVLAPGRLAPALAAHRIVVVPGFVALEDQRIVTLGRGGSDWSAVLLATALGATRCERIKDVDGDFTADPAVRPEARLISCLPFTAALHTAEDGCPLVQRHALAEAARARLPLVIRSLASPGTLVQESRHGVCDQDHPLQSAAGSGDRIDRGTDLPDDHL